MTNALRGARLKLRVSSDGPWVPVEVIGTSHCGRIVESLRITSAARLAAGEVVQIGIFSHCDDGDPEQEFPARCSVVEASDAPTFAVLVPGSGIEIPADVAENLCLGR